MKAARKEELAKASPGKRIDLIAVVSDLVGNEQTLHPLGRIVALPSLLYGLDVAAVPPPALVLVVVAATGQAPCVILELHLLGGKVIDPAAEEFKVLFEIGVGAEIESVEVGVLAVDIAIGVAVAAIGNVGKESPDKAGVGQVDGDLLENLLGVQKVILARLLLLDRLLSKAVALQCEVAIAGLHWVVQDNDGVGAEVSLVRELILQQGRGGVRAKIHRLVPSDAVVVDVDLPKHLHHFHLNLVSVETGGIIVETGIAVPTLDDEIGLVGLREREGVRNFQNAISDVEAEERSRHHLRQRLLTMLYNFQQGLEGKLRNEQKGGTCVRNIMCANF